MKYEYQPNNMRNNTTSNGAGSASVQHTICLATLGRSLFKDTKKVDNASKVKMQVQKVHHILRPLSTSDDGMMPSRANTGASMIFSASTFLAT